MQGQSISKLEIISLSVGAIIGWGAFILPGEFFIKKNRNFKFYNWSFNRSNNYDDY